MNAHRFNPNHDPDNGQFAEGGGGGTGGGLAAAVQDHASAMKSAAENVATQLGILAPSSIPAAPKETGDKANANWRKSLNDSQAKSITDYTGGDYKQIRAYQEGRLKPGQPGYTKAKADAENISAAITQAPKERGTFYRGMYNLTPETTAKLSTVGNKFTTNSFSSFTESSKKAMGFATDANNPANSFVVFKLENSEGVNISKLSAYKDEKEVLIDKGRTFKIVGSVKKDFKSTGATQHGFVVTLAEAA